MSSLSLLAVLLAAPAAANDDPMSRPEIVWGTLGITACLLVAAGVIYAVGKWRERMANSSQNDPNELSSYRAMYEAGEITEAEYAELRRRMADKVKKMPLPGTTPAQPGERPTLNPPTPPAKPTQSPPPPSTA